MADESIDLKRISALSTEATRSDWLANTFFAVDNASIGTKKLAASILVTILNNFANEFKSDVACVAGKCYWKDGVLYKCKNAHSGTWSDNDFDVATVDDIKQTLAHLLPNEKYDGYLALSDTNGTGKFDIENIFNNFADKFDPTRTSEKPYKAGESVAYDGKTYVFKVDHYGVWNENDVERTPISELLASTISREDAVYTQSSTYDELKPGYYASADGYGQNALYDTFVFEAKHDGKIYPISFSQSYFSITVFDNASQNSGVRYRKVSGGENTLPTEQNPASFVKGNYIAITTSTGIDFDCALVGYSVRKILNKDVSLDDKQVNQVLSNIEQVVDVVEVDAVYTQSSTYDELKPGYYASADGYGQNALYDTFVFEADKDGSFYPISFSQSYFSITVFDNASQNSGVRYRKLSGGENTLPTEQNPASFVKGNYIAITTSTGVDFSVLFEDYKSERVFKNDILFSQGQKDQVLALQRSKIICKFINSSGADASTQRFEVFVPSKVGYVKYVFVHSVSVSKNSDCWRMSGAFAVDDDFSTRFQLTDGGEWECAIRLVGRSDFSGGIVHGNEILIDASFWADGEKLDLSNLSSEPFYCSEFRISTSTHLYDKEDGTTNFADHGCEHIFSLNGCEISQSVKFIINSDIMTAYLAMGLPSASVTDHYYVDSEISGGVPVPASQKVITSDLRKFVIFGEDTGVLFTIELLADYPFLENPYRGLLVHGGYNKAYFIIRYNDNYTAVANTIWMTKHKVNFEVGL